MAVVGANVPRLNLFDIILTKEVFTEGNFALTFDSQNCHIINSSDILNDKIISTAKEQNVDLIVGNTICTEVFDEYIVDTKSYLDRIPKDFNGLACEMEAFSLLYIAKKLNKNAACLMTVVDSVFHDCHATSEERETNLNKMIKLALDSI